MDFVYLGGIAAFFFLAVALAQTCEWLRKPKH